MNITGLVAPYGGGQVPPRVGGPPRIGTEALNGLRRRGPAKRDQPRCGPTVLDQPRRSPGQNWGPHGRLRPKGGKERETGLRRTRCVQVLTFGLAVWALS
jgi:hypothetical protein